jgi:hypothetical protein
VTVQTRTRSMAMSSEMIVKSKIEESRGTKLGHWSSRLRSIYSSHNALAKLPGAPAKPTALMIFFRGSGKTPGASDSQHGAPSVHHNAIPRLFCVLDSSEIALAGADVARAAFPGDQTARFSSGRRFRGADDSFGRARRAANRVRRVPRGSRTGRNRVGFRRNRSCLPCDVFS